MAAWKSWSVEKLARALTELSDAYYNDAARVSDDVYDAMAEHLATLAPGHPALRAVGAPIRSERAKVPLPYRMGSLDKWKAEDPQVQARLRRWAREHVGPYVVSQKLDGSSCLLVWRRRGTSGWAPPRMFTRGDGRTGVDLGHLVPFVVPQGVGARLAAAFPDVDEVAVRGELLVARAVFRRKYADMARPRSLVNGLVNRKETDPAQARDVDVVLYEVVHPRLPKTEQMSRLRALGMPVVEHAVVEGPLEATALEARLRRERGEAVYDMDGLVVEAEGPYPLTADRTPDYAVAFKAAEDAVVTRVVAVHWAASKDGLWKPTVEYEPVHIAGTVLRHATGFHGQFVRDQRVGPGAMVRVGLGGDVVPQILEVVQPAETPSLPPAGTFAWDEGGVELRLAPEVAQSLPEYRRAQLRHFVTTLKIPHLSEGTLTKLQEAAGVDSVPALLRLTAEQVARLPGLGPKSAQRLVEGIRAATTDVPAARLMAASNAFGRGFAEKRLQAVLDRFPSVARDDGPIPPTEDLRTVDGIEERTAGRFRDGLVRFREWRALVPEITLLAAPTSPAPPPPTDARWAGQVVVFTGFRSQELAGALTARGARVEDALTRRTTLLVVRDLDAAATNKVQKAREYGARIVRRAELEAELQN